MGINYSIETDPETTARGIIRDRPISLKHSKEIARELRGMTVGEARRYLAAVLEKRRSVPFKQHNSGVGHRSDLQGWDAGRYPQKATKAFVELLENVAANATEQGFDAEAMTIIHLAPHKVGVSRGSRPRAFGRASPWNGTLCDVELVIEAPEAA